MSGEIVVQSRLRVANGSLLFDTGLITKSIDQAALGGPSPGYWIVGTTEENTTFPDLTSEGLLWMINLDPTNFVEWGFSTGVYGGKMLAGEPAGPFRVKPGTTLYMKSDTAACKVAVYCLEA